jgi:coenzyme PQQ precursor peptide PqqA
VILRALTRWPVLDFEGAAGILHLGCNKKTEVTMAWKNPKIVEIALGAEINSYACADLKK